MRCLHVVNISFVLPYFIGEQFDYFSNRDIELYVACSPSKHFSEYALEKRFHPIEVNIVREINILADIKAIYQLVKHIRKNKIDIVIGHTPKGGFIAMIAAYFLGIKKRVYFRHGIMFETSTGLKKIILKTIEQIGGYLASDVVCVSPSVLTISNNLRLSQPRKNILLGKGTCNGINIFRFRRSEDSNITPALENIGKNNFVLGYVGRLVKDKGIIELIEAWKKLINEYNNIKLLLVGPFEERDALPADIIKYILTESSIIYTGLINDTVPYYYLMDVFILPSYREGFPTVVLEASAMELPIITTRSTGCIDAIIENVTGIFTKIESEDIYIKVKYYLNDVELRKLHGIDGRNFVVNNFNQEMVWNEIEKKVLKNDKLLNNR